MHFEKLTQQLEKFGFTRAQAKLYLAGVRLKQALMAPLAKTAGMKRTTAYYMMRELERRGFFRRKKISKRYYYFAATPHRLLEMTKQRERLVRKLIPELEKLVSTSPAPRLSLGASSPRQWRR